MALTWNVSSINGFFFPCLNLQSKPQLKKKEKKNVGWFQYMLDWEAIRKHAGLSWPSAHKLPHRKWHHIASCCMCKVRIGCWVLPWGRRLTTTVVKKYHGLMLQLQRPHAIRLEARRVDVQLNCCFPERLANVFDGGFRVWMEPPPNHPKPNGRFEIPGLRWPGVWLRQRWWFLAITVATVTSEQVFFRWRSLEIVLWRGRCHRCCFQSRETIETSYRGHNAPSWNQWDTLYSFQAN